MPEISRYKNCQRRRVRLLQCETEFITILDLNDIFRISIAHVSLSKKRRKKERIDK